MFVSLKGKLKRIDSGMSKEEFAEFLTKNLERSDPLATRDRTRFADGTCKPLSLWMYQRYEYVRAFRAMAFVVKPEYEEEIIGALMMLGEIREVSRAPSSLQHVMACLGLKATHGLFFGDFPEMISLSEFDYTLRKAKSLRATIMALKTDKCWFVYPTNIGRVNRLLIQAKEKLND